MSGHRSIGYGSRSKMRILLAFLALLFASGLSVWSIFAPRQGYVVLAAAPADGVQLAKSAPLAQSGEVRRESAVSAPSGQLPLTGPASPFQPLDNPVFGANYRANTDTQSPNRAQQEPSIAVNPTNPLNVVAMAKDERGGQNTKQTWIYSSTDGGVTWINQLFPFAPQSPFSSDPVVNFSDDGICYVTSLPYGGGTNDGIQIARSTDGGITFSSGVHLPGTNGGTDKEWTWIDNNPGSPYYHRIYVAWMDFGTGGGWSFNYSTDRGVSFSSPSGFFLGYQFPMPVSLPNGDVIVSYLSNSAQISYRRSTDGGATFLGVQPISPVTFPDCPPDNSGCGIWRLNAIPSNSVNRNNGNMVLVWADGRAPNNTATIYFSRSTDNGATWSPAAILAPPGVANTYQVEPWVEADEQGTFHAIWYDDRENPNTSIFHIYYSQSTDNGASWSTATRISTATSDLRIGIPSSYNLAAGDYINVTASHGNVYAVWTDTRSGTGEDIYVVRGTYGGTPTPTVTGTPPTSTPTSIVPTSTSTATRTNTAVVPTSTRTATRTATSLPTNTATATATASNTPQPPTGTATSQVATTTPTVCTISFTDVPPDHPFYTWIRCLACRGIISGYSDGTFQPGNDITRGQIAKMVSNSAGFSENPGPQIYEDVPPASPFYAWINRLSMRGHMGGYPCGLVPEEPCEPPDNRPYFRPNASATRGQLAKIVSNAAGLGGTPTGLFFADVFEDNPFYVWIMRLTQLGVMSGYPCGEEGEPCDGENRPYFRPFNNVTRGQASKIVANTFFPDCQTPSR
ncbi:MAG TPA: S-layer homology domain-containing protein [Chloroflexia bacterium]|nr:S-layer homology domain-containing protein [Chloroflexia bacterium]